MSLPWSAEQMEWLREMGFDVLARRTRAGPAAPQALHQAGADPSVPVGLARAARGVDLTPLLAGGIPRDVAARRALWRALRPLRKAARVP